jgi:hypothetical protein
MVDRAEKEPLPPGAGPSAAFTPGPWVLWGHTTIAKRPPGAFFHTKDAIATVHQVGDWHANARLIAAAPDLLATLQRIAAATPNSTNSRTIAEFQSWCHAVAGCAIAQALGPSAHDTSSATDPLRDANT